MYTDFGLFTCDPALTRDVVNLFHHLTGYSRAPRFEKLLVAPLNMRERFIELIEREADQRPRRPAGAHRRQDEPARGPARSARRSATRRRPACRST